MLIDNNVWAGIKNSDPEVSLGVTEPLSLAQLLITLFHSPCVTAQRFSTLFSESASATYVYIYIMLILNVLTHLITLLLYSGHQCMHCMVLLYVQYNVKWFSSWFAKEKVI